MSLQNSSGLIRLLVPFGLILLVSCTTTGPTASGPFLMRDMGNLALEVDHSDVLGPKEAIDPRSGAPYRTYLIDLSGGDVVLITATSSDFDPGLSLFTTDGALLGSADSDSGGRTTLARRVPKTDSYLLVISGSEAGGYGAFEVETGTIEPTEGISLPGSVRAFLAGGGEMHPNTGGFMNTFPLELSEAAVVEITLRSQDFDTFLSLARAPNRIIFAENDDFGDSTDSRLLVELEPGDYEILATSYGPGAIGHYTLELSEATIQRSDSFELGSLYHGFMGTGRDQIPSSERTGQPLAFEIRQEARYDFLMRSDDFDAYLVLTDSQGNVVAEDDDSGGGLDARIVTTLSPGTYVLWASSFSAADAGRFTVMAEEFRDEAPAASISFGSSVSGSLSETSPVCRRRGARIQYYNLAIHTPTNVQIDMVSEEIDTFLFLEDASGEVIEANDDVAPNDTNSRIIFRLEPGNYRIGASAFGEEEMGSFTLSVSEAAHDAGL